MSTSKEEEIQAKREEAVQQMNQAFNSTRPKGIGEGVTSGVGNIVTGAVGAAGVAVLLPTMGLAVGLRGGGLIGGVVGLAGGAVAGAIGGAAIAVAGVTSGVVQIGRGVAAVPQSIVAPRKGKWWNEAEGRWVLTNMDEEAKSLEVIPENDDDILGKLKQDLDEGAELKGSGEVVDTYYYDTLEVPIDADPAVIKRKYYLLARKYHPDKVGSDDKEAAEKFKAIAEAYQVLSDPELRKKYNSDGRSGLSPDKTSVADGGMPKVDPAVLFAFLFGSDKFNDYIGRLSTATAASVGDSPKVSLKEARTLQKRRVTRLALKMINKITPWVEHAQSGSVEGTSLVEAEWTSEATTLAEASYGYQLLTTIGKAYNLVAVVYQGSLDSGHGIPSISQWATKRRAEMGADKDENKNKMETLRAGLDMMKLQGKLQKQLAETKTDEEKEKITKEMEDAAATIMLRVLWTTTVVDITAAVHEAMQMVFFDSSVDKEIRLLRSSAVKKLGEIWMDIPQPSSANEEEKDAKRLYEEAAFAAMLETVKRKDEAQAASH